MTFWSVYQIVTDSRIDEDFQLAAFAFRVMTPDEKGGDLFQCNLPVCKGIAYFIISYDHFIQLFFQF